jgi:hypothetical protein
MRLADHLIEPIDVAATTEQVARHRCLLRGLTNLAGLQCRIGLRQLGLANLAQTTAGTIVVRLQRHHLLKQLARAGAALAIQAAILQGLLRLRQHVVQIGSRQHRAQAGLAEPERAEQHHQQQRQQRDQPATTRWRCGCPPTRSTRLGTHLRQAIGRHHARRVQPVEIAQGGFAARVCSAVVLIPAYAHGSRL